MLMLKNKGRIGRFCDYLCPKSIILCRVYVGNYLSSSALMLDIVLCFTSNAKRIAT